MDITSETPLLQHLKVPPVFRQSGVEKMAGETPIQADTTFPPCAFAKSKYEGAQRFPQTIAHRGYKAEFPENTMGAFTGAVKVGANAIETDLHITKDDVVVLSHDATLARCYGKPDKIIDRDWEYIRKLKTIKEPQQYMPRLQDLLEYVAQPGLEDIWLLLDIKLDNDSDAIMRLIAETIKSVAPAASKPWHTRIVLGCWAAKYLPLADHYLSGFPVTHIGFSVSYARQFFEIPNVSFNMFLPLLQAPGGKKFIKKTQALNRPIFAWTVNVENKMEWCIHRNLDGVITDDPKLFLDVCHRHDSTKPEPAIPMLQVLDSLRIWLFAAIFGLLYRSRLDRKEQKKAQFFQT